MIRTVIIDDSAHSIDYLSGLIKELTPTIELLGSASDIESGASLIDKIKPGLVFLDIEIGNKTGFDLLKSLSVIDFEVVFISGYNIYALEAFNHNALHYLLKPIDPQKLIEAVNRLEIKFNKNGAMKPTPIEIPDNTSLQGSKRIAINTEKETKFIHSSDVLFIKAEGRYSTIHLQNEKNIVISKLLKEMEIQFSTEEFYRVSKSHLINLNHVSSIKHIDGGTIAMSDGTTMAIPRRKRDEFTIRITSFIS